MSVELFYQKVYDVTSRIPSGKVATYGQIAALCGNPRAARAVGNALHRNPFPETVPCFRVVNAAGDLSGGFAFGGKLVQKALLEEDGIEVTGFRVDLKEYLWDGNIDSEI